MAFDPSLDNVGSVPHRALLAMVWACFSTAFTFVAVRTFIRLRVVTRLAVEDYWMFLALAALLTLCILETIQLQSLYYMTGVIAGVIPISADLISFTEEYLRFEFPIVILFWTVLWSVKAGFLALYYKLFRELALYRRVWYALAGFCFLAYVGSITTLCLSCRPISNFFEFAQCGRADDVWAANFSVYFSTAIDVFTDVCIMAMPLRLIYNVQISKKQKIGLVCVFGLCFVMIAFAIIRAKQVLVEQYFVNLTLLMIWSTLAASISVIVGSLPAFKLLVTNRSAIKHSRYGGSSAGSAGGRSKKGVFSSNNNGGIRSKTIQMSPISERKSPSGRFPDDGDSTEDILKGEGMGHFVVVKHDVTVSYDEMDHPRNLRPHPAYHNRPPAVAPYGNAI